VIKRQGFKYKLKPNEQVEATCRLFAGHRRFVYNYFVELNKYRLNNGWKILWYDEMEFWLSKILMESDELAWLGEAPKASLQQALRDLDKAYKDAFDKTQPLKRLPRRKKRTVSNTFRFPQIRSKKKDGSYNHNLKVENKRVFLPKIGWVGFYKSRDIIGDIKNVTVSKEAGSWFVSIQTEYQVAEPVHPSNTAVGCDRGVTLPFAFSDGTKTKAIKAAKQLASKLAKLQRKAAKQVKFSNNWNKTQEKVRKVHHKVACIRKDHLHKLSTNISKNHAMIYLEDLGIGNMTKRANPKPSEDGSGYERNNAAAKSGLNKAILDVGWGMFAEFLKYKQHWRGGYTALVPAPHTSQTCIACGHKSKDNRHTQARFCCAECGFQGNADFVASINIETRGQTGRFAHSVSHETSCELLEFSRGLVCGSLLLTQQRKQKTVGSRETLPPRRKKRIPTYMLFEKPPLKSACLI
jgi:putative transposase